VSPSSEEPLTRSQLRDELSQIIDEALDRRVPPPKSAQEKHDEAEMTVVLAASLGICACLLWFAYRHDTHPSMTEVYVSCGIVGTTACLGLVAALTGRFWRRIPSAVIYVLALINGVIWIETSLDWTMSLHNKGCFEHMLTKTDALYFVVTTFATVGFGDLHPISQGCRQLVTGQVIANFVVVTVLIGTAIARVTGVRRTSP